MSFRFYNNQQLKNYDNKILNCTLEGCHNYCQSYSNYYLNLSDGNCAQNKTSKLYNK